MRLDYRPLSFVQILLLLVVPLDAFALTPGHVNGGGQKTTRGLSGRGKPTASWRAPPSFPPARPEVADAAVLNMSGGGDGGQVGVLL